MVLPRTHGGHQAKIIIFALRRLMQLVFVCLFVCLVNCFDVASAACSLFAQCISVSAIP